MAKISFPGMDAYVDKLYALEQRIEPILKQAVFDGAGEVASAIRGSIDSLPGGLPKPLKQGLGISTMKNENGFINVKIGFDGYYTGHTGRDVPVLLVARAVESGTSTIKKQPFVRPAVTKAKAAAEAKMQKKIDEEIEKIMK